MLILMVLSLGANEGARHQAEAVFFAV